MLLHLINKILSLVLHAGIKEANIAEKHIIRQRDFTEHVGNPVSHDARMAKGFGRRA